jgi:hypothetical protein
MKRRGIIVAALVAALGVTSLASAAPVNVPNGGFERGVFKPWKRVQPGGGTWGLYNVAPRGIGFPKPTEGTTAAGLTQTGPGLNILHRRLQLKPRKTNRISLDLFYDNSADDFASPRHFRYEGSAPNQQLRIDVVKPKAPIRSLKAKNVLATIFRTRPGDPLERSYAPVTANLTKLGVRRERVRLRIAEVDNQLNFEVAVDNLTQTAD